MAVSLKSQFPVPKRPNWLIWCTGGLMTTGGLGYCLRIAYAKEPELAVATYLAGSVGLCLQNISFYYRPVKSSSIPNWMLFCSGGVLSGIGFGYCLRLAMQEHPKSTTVAYIVGSLGYVISNLAIYAAVMFENRRKKFKYQFSRNPYSADKMFHIPKCKNPIICLKDGMFYCKNCEAYYGGANVETKADRAAAMARREDFLRTMMKSLKEIESKDGNLAVRKICNGNGLYEIRQQHVEESKDETTQTAAAMARREDFLRTMKKSLKEIESKDGNLAIGKICNGNGLYEIRRRHVEESKDETTQTESWRRMMGTQTQENMEIRLEKRPPLQLDDLVKDFVDDLLNGDQQPKEALN